jgi:hypothetical protein
VGSDALQTDPQARLQELLGELAAHRGDPFGDCSQSYDRALPDARKLEHVPLVHRMSRVDDLTMVVEARALLSRKSRGGAASKPEDYLGITDVVYTSAGTLYPDARVAFVFSPLAERAGAEASPWDSGALCRSLCPGLPRPPEPARRELFIRYTLPAPQYRSYLVHYVASCYRVWEHYLDLGCAHAFSDPAQVLETHPRSRSFEVRVPGRIAVSESFLLAVFLRDVDLPLDARVTRWLDVIERAGVIVEQCSGSSRLLEEHVRLWILRHLEGLE